MAPARGGEQEQPAQCREQKPPRPPRGAEDPEQRLTFPCTLFFPALLSVLLLFAGGLNSCFSTFNPSVLQEATGH